MTTDEFLRKFERCTASGWLTTDEALLLVKYAEQTQGPMVEIGSYFGRSAMLFAQLPADEGGLIYRRVYCVDPWDDTFSTDYTGDEIFKRFQENVSKIPGADVVPVRMRVENWPAIAAEFIYLDGDHTYWGTHAQIEKALTCKPKYIAVHDVNDEGEGVDVKRAALERLGEWTERVGRLAVWGPVR